MKYDLTTSNSDNASGYYAKVFTIPRLNDVYINTFNMIFEVYHVNAYNEPVIQRYALALLSTKLRLTRFQDINKLEINTNDTVGYVVNEKTIDVYVKSVYQYACVYINVLGASNIDISIKHHYAKFESEEPTGIVYATLKENLVTTVDDLSNRFLKTTATRTLSGTIYHSGISVDITLPEKNRYCFGIVCDRADMMAYIYIDAFSKTITVKNIGTTEINATFDFENKTITFSNLSTQRFLHYIMNFSY